MPARLKSGVLTHFYLEGLFSSSAGQPVSKPVDHSTPERVTVCPTRLPQFSLVEAMSLLEPIAVHSGARERRGDV